MRSARDVRLVAAEPPLELGAKVIRKRRDGTSVSGAEVVSKVMLSCCKARETFKNS